MENIDEIDGKSNNEKPDNSFPSDLLAYHAILEAQMGEIEDLHYKVNKIIDILNKQSNKEFVLDIPSILFGMICAFILSQFSCYSIFSHSGMGLVY